MRLVTSATDPRTVRPSTDWLYVDKLSSTIEFLLLFLKKYNNHVLSLNYVSFYKIHNDSSHSKFLKEGVSDES